MALNFTSAGSKTLESSAVPLTDVPCTLAAWCRPTAVTASMDVLSITNGKTVGLFDALRLNVGGNVAGDPIRAITSINGSNAIAVSSTGVTSGTWCHAAAVFAGVADRRSFINGGSKVTDTTSKTLLLPLANVNISGEWSNAVRSVYFDGDIAEAGIWNVALTDADILALSTGVSPLKVRPEALVSYWPILGVNSPEIDRVGRIELAYTNSPTAAAHTKILVPASPFYVNTASAAPAASQPLFTLIGVG